MHQLFAWLTAVMWTVGYGWYLLVLVRRQIRPSLGFWLTIAIVDDVLLVAQLRAGAYGVALLQTMIWVVGANLTLVTTGWQQRREIHLNRYERVCVVLSVCSLVMAGVIPGAAVVIQTIGMVISGIPLWINAMRGNERWQPIGICLVASLLNLGALQNWTLANWPGLLPHLAAVLQNVISTATAALGSRPANQYHPPGT